MNIGPRIRDLRKERELTARDLSHRIDLTETSIYRIERGERMPSAATVEAIARGLAVPVCELLGDPCRRREGAG